MLNYSSVETMRPQFVAHRNAKMVRSFVTGKVTFVDRTLNSCE